MYLARVCSTTSGGSSGAGGLWSQPVASAQSRTNCLSKEGCVRPGADDLRGALEVDVLVVVAELGLGRRGEDRLGQPLGLAQPSRKLDAAHRTRLAVLAPPGPGQVAANHALDRVHL